MLCAKLYHFKMPQLWSIYMYINVCHRQKPYKQSKQLYKLSGVNFICLVSVASCCHDVYLFCVAE